MNENPFILWECYQKSNKRFFFGREKEIKEIKEKLGKNILIFFGSSGTGKSSICKAGLLPDIYIEDYNLEYLEKEFSIEENNFKNFEKLILTKKNPLVILDQFEKIFYDPESCTAFVDYLIRDLYKNNSFKLLITIREENIGDLFTYSTNNQLSLLSDDTGFYLHPIERSTIIKVFQKIFKKAGIEIEEKAAINVVDTIEKATQRLELADMQAVGYELFNNYLDNINEIDSTIIYKIIDGFYLRLYEDLSFEEKRVLHKGISSSGERIKISASDFDSTLIKELLNKRLIKQVGENFEITHEHLLKQIINTLSVEELTILRVEELIHRATEDYHYNNELLLDYIRLKNVNKYKEKLFLNISETELVLISTLTNDSSRQNRFYWLKKYSDFYPDCMDMFTSILQEGILEKSNSDITNRILVLEILKYLYDSNKIEQDNFFKIIKYGFIAKHRDIIFKTVDILPVINEDILDVVLDLFISIPEDLMNLVFLTINNKKGKELVLDKLKEWALCEDKEKIMRAYEYFKVCKITPKEISLTKAKPDENRYIYDFSLHVNQNEKLDDEIPDALSILFSFDDLLKQYVLTKAKQTDDYIDNFYLELSKYTAPPYNVFFRNTQDFFDYEGFLHSNKINTTYYSGGSIDVKDYKSFTLLSFTEKNPVFGKTESTIKSALANAGTKSKYLINFSNLDVSSTDFLFGLIKAISEVSPEAEIYSCCATEHLRKKLLRFRDIAYMLSLKWFV